MYWKKKEAIVKTYLSWLSEVDWSHYLTLTFLRRQSEEESQNRLKRFFHLLNCEVYGRRYRNHKGKKGLYYFATAEKQTTTQNTHFHLVLSFPNQNEMVKAYREGEKTISKEMLRAFWKKAEGGIMRTDFFPTLQEEREKVLAYCVKQFLEADEGLFFERLPAGLKGRKQDRKRELN